MVEVFRYVLVHRKLRGRGEDENCGEVCCRRKDANYEGVRVTLLGTLDGARCAMQIDVGYGDAVTPAADSVLFPVVLEECRDRRCAPILSTRSLRRNTKRW
jgi:hypothetical protein